MSEELTGAGLARREIGLPERTYQDEALAPPVDLSQLQAYLRRRLSPEADLQVADLIASFRSWDDACTGLLLQEVKETCQEGEEVQEGEQSGTEVAASDVRTEARSPASGSEPLQESDDPEPLQLASLHDQAREKSRRGKYDQALDLAREAYALALQRFGESDSQTIAALKQLLGCYEEAWRQTNEQRRWAIYLSWLLGMVRMLIEREVVDSTRRRELTEILDGLHIQLARGEGPRFRDGNDLWCCLLDNALLEHAPSRASPAAEEGIPSGSTETEQDWSIEDYPKTPEFAQAVASHYRRCIALLESHEAASYPLAVGKLKGMSDEALADSLGKTIHYVHSALRIIRHRWKPGAEPAWEPS